LKRLVNTFAIKFDKYFAYFANILTAIKARISIRVMKPSHLIKHFGSEIRAAKGIGVTRQAVNLWMKANRIPKQAQFMIELLTGGRLRADKELRK
jgi:predicted transcriptional regulator